MCVPGTSREPDNDTETSDSDEGEAGESEHLMRDDHDDIMDGIEPEFLLDREYSHFVDALRAHERWCNVSFDELLSFRRWVAPFWHDGMSLSNAFFLHWPLFRDAEMPQANV